MITPVHFPAAATQLTASAVTQYTCPANTRAIVVSLLFTNTTGTARTITLHLIRSGGSAADNNKIWDVRIIPPDTSGNGSLKCHEIIGQVLEPGDFIQALADSATAVTINGSVIERTP